MDHNEKWLQWAVKLQSIAQAGLFYGKDEFDKERYEQIRNIAAEMISYKSEISEDKVKDLFCSETGYQTPKIDTRAAILRMENSAGKGKGWQVVTSRRLGGCRHIGNRKCDQGSKRRGRTYCDSRYGDCGAG